MSPHSGLSDTTTRFPIEIRRLPWIKRLAADYASDYGRLADFFAGDPSDRSAWVDAIARAQRHPRAHAALADIVLAQQQQRKAPQAARASAERLRGAQTVAVVTGQQAGLFGGPLFTLLKALTALRLAEEVTRQYGVAAVPVFWIDAEDHDWNEVKACGVLDASLRFAEIALPNLPGADAEPVARVRLDGSISAALTTLRSLLPATEFSGALFESLEAAYRPGAGMVDAFASWLEAVLGRRGLVLFNSADPAAKPLAAALFAHEIEHAGQTSQLATDAGSDLVARGYHAQVAPQPDQPALFRLDGVRASVRRDEVPAMLERVRSTPGEFSPNVLLRPLVQDTLFPTVCYVAGPNELAYLAQLRGVYAAFGVPMPLMYQRASATIFDSNAMRFLTRHELTLELLRAQDESALNRVLAAQIPEAVHTSLEETKRAIEKQMSAVAHAVATLDATLDGAARSTAGRMQDDLKKLHAKIVQAIKRKDETLRRQFHHAQAQAFPGGEPQERAVGFVYFLNKYGPSLVDRLDEIPLTQGMHWLVAL